MAQTKMATNVDAFIGRRLRETREQFSMSQDTLGDKIGVSFQQVQKYENGTNRISASRLYKVSKTFNIPISVFFPKDVAA